MKYHNKANCNNFDIVYILKSIHISVLIAKSISYSKLDAKLMDFR